MDHTTTPRLLSRLLPALLAVAACGGDDILVLEITAERPARRLRVDVKQAPELAVYSEEFDVDPAGHGRDISDPAQAYRLAVDLAGGGRYGVHIVDVTDGPRPSQSWAGWFQVDGVVHGKAHLQAFELGDDDDGDGWPETCPPAGACDTSLLDCADGDASRNPFAVEICGDGIDQDCDGADRACRDEDNDGVDERTDCDDHDPTVHPGAHESATTCDGPDPKCGDGIDQDCDGIDPECHVDLDCDGHYPDGVGDEYDCNDNDPRVYAGALEICGDEIDNDCDDVADEGCAACDEDGDGYYGWQPDIGCEPAQPLTDCDDRDRAIHPGATDDCGGLEGGAACAARGFCGLPAVDEDCDGQANEGCPDPSCDADGDGFAAAACNPPAGSTDCNDADPTVYPGAPDRCGDGIKQNCQIDLPCSDADGDGYNQGADCDDTEPGVHPWAIEVCDGVDQDCDGVVDEGNPGVTPGSTLDGEACNADSDGVCAPVTGHCVCSPQQPPGHFDETTRVRCTGETAGAAWGPRCFGAPQPGYEECDDIDQDCDGHNDDLDDDQLGLPCHDLPSPCVKGRVTGCDPSRNTPYFTNPHWVCSPDMVGPQTELCNAVDDDCDTRIDEDFSLGLLCDGPDSDQCREGVTVCRSDGSGTECNDTTGNSVELCNGADDDCDGQTDEGFSLGVSCDGPDADQCNEGVTVCRADGLATTCNDATGDSVEVCNNVDDDCDGQKDEGFALNVACDGPDSDLCENGHTVCTADHLGVRCDETGPGILDVCNNRDDDCNPATPDGADDALINQPCDGPDTDLCPEGVTYCNGSIRCSDTTGNNVETCNGLDDDCDGQKDEGATCTDGKECINGSCQYPIDAAPPPPPDAPPPDAGLVPQDASTG